MPTLEWSQQTDLFNLLLIYFSYCVNSIKKKIKVLIDHKNLCVGHENIIWYETWYTFRTVRLIWRTKIDKTYLTTRILNCWSAFNIFKFGRLIYRLSVSLPWQNGERLIALVKNIQIFNEIVEDLSLRISVDSFFWIFYVVHLYKLISLPVLYQYPPIE